MLRVQPRDLQSLARLRQIVERRVALRDRDDALLRGKNRQHLAEPPNPAAIRSFHRHTPFLPQPAQGAWIGPRLSGPRPRRINNLEQLTALRAAEVAGKSLRLRCMRAADASQLKNLTHRVPMNSAYHRGLLHSQRSLRFTCNSISEFNRRLPPSRSATIPGLQRRIPLQTQ